MRFTLLISCLISVHADKASYEAGIAKVIDSLEQVVIPGDSELAGEALGRKLYVSHLLHSVEKFDPNLSESDAARAMLNQVVELLEDIHEKMVNMTGEKQTLLDNIMTNVAECATEYGTQTDGIYTGDTAYEKLHNDTEEDHTLCRVAEEALLADSNTECDTFYTELKSESDGGFKVCYSPFNDLSVIEDLQTFAATTNTAEDLKDSWEPFFHNQRDHFNASALGTSATACRTKYDLWAEKKRKGWKRRGGQLPGRAARLRGGSLQFQIRA